MADLTLHAFFFLLRPGEYCEGGKNTLSATFCLHKVTFFRDNCHLPAFASTLRQQCSANFIALCFTNQKNGVKGGSMGHGCSFNDVADPLTILDCRVSYLLENGTHSGTLLCAYRQGSRWKCVRSADITMALRAVVESCGPALGILLGDIST